MTTTTITRMPDLRIERDQDGTTTLSQDLGCGERHSIQLHQVQIRHLAEVSGVLTSAPDDLAVRTRKYLLRLSRRIALARDLCAVQVYGESPAVEDLMHALNAADEIARGQLEDIGATEFIDDVHDAIGGSWWRASEAREKALKVEQAGTKAPKSPPPQKPAVAPPVAPTTSTRSSLELLMTTVAAHAPGITRAALVKTLTGKLGRTQAYDAISGLVATKILTDNGGLLSVRARSGRDSDAEPKCQPPSI